jgi:hypothetical protein
VIEALSEHSNAVYDSTLEMVEIPAPEMSMYLYSVLADNLNVVLTEKLQSGDLDHESVSELILDTA